MSRCRIRNLGNDESCSCFFSEDEAVFCRNIRELYIVNDVVSVCDTVCFFCLADHVDSWMRIDCGHGNFRADRQLWRGLFDGDHGSVSRKD